MKSICLYFYFNNNWIDVLIDAFEEDFLNDITFDYIWIDDNVNLTRIHANAFLSTSLTLKAFDSLSSKLINDDPNYNVFDAFRKCWFDYYLLF